MRTRRILATVASALAVLVVAAIGAGCGSSGGGAKPSISALIPDTAAVSAEVQIVGQSFGSSQGTSVVHFGTQIAPVSAWADSQVTVRVPSNLGAATWPVTVQTNAGGGNEMDFTVVSDGKQPDRKSGQIEQVTAAQAMTAYEQKKGKDFSGYTFSIVQVSDKDPKWKVDVAIKSGQPSIYFLLHQENVDWVVKDDGTALTKAQLTAAGAPSDLYGTPSATSQYQAVVNYMTKQGISPSGVSVVVTRTSITDPSWELGLATQAGQPDQVVVLHKVNGNWTVVAMASNLTYDQLINLGVPKDIAHTNTEAQAIVAWIQAGNAPPGVTATGWALSVVDVSTVDADWEIVKGVQNPGAGTMYFLLHWENGQWVVKDTGNALTPQEINAPGMPSDLP